MVVSRSDLKFLLLNACPHLPIEFPSKLLFLYSCVSVFHLASNNWWCNCGMFHWKMIPITNGRGVQKKTANRPQPNTFIKSYRIKIRSYNRYAVNMCECFGIWDKINLLYHSNSANFRHMEKPHPKLKTHIWNHVSSINRIVIACHGYKPHQFIFPAFPTKCPFSRRPNPIQSNPN